MANPKPQKKKFEIKPKEQSSKQRHFSAKEIFESNSKNLKDFFAKIKKSEDAYDARVVRGLKLIGSPDVLRLDVFQGGDEILSLRNANILMIQPDNIFVKEVERRKVFKSKTPVIKK